MYQHFILKNVSTLYSFLCQITFPRMDRPHVLFHSSAEEHLVCFYFLAAVNNAAVSTCMCVCVHLFAFLLGICMGVESWSYGSSMFNISGTCLADSLHDLTSYIPTNKAWGSPSFTVLPTLAIVYLSNFSFSSVYKIIAHHSGLHSSKREQCGTCFQGLLVHLCIFLREMSM